MSNPLHVTAAMAKRNVIDTGRLGYREVMTPTGPAFEHVPIDQATVRVVFERGDGHRPIGVDVPVDGKTPATITDGEVELAVAQAVVEANAVIDKHETAAPQAST